MTNTHTDLEHWVPVKGFPRYIISNHGNVADIGYGYIKPLKPFPCKNGRLRVQLHNNEKFTIRSIHRLVLTSFVGECPEGKECSHIDGNHLNNRPKNLIWETRKQNFARKKEHGTYLHGETGHDAKFTNQQAKDILSALGG